MGLLIVSIPNIWKIIQMFQTTKQYNMNNYQIDR